MRDKKGRFKKGNPGKPKNAKNHFTRIKEDMLSVWKDIDGKKRLKEYAKTNPRNFFKVTELIAGLLPKEFQHSGEVTLEIISYANTKK